MDKLEKEYAFESLLASGTAVGLSEGLMGNSEVGYAIYFLSYLGGRN